MRVKSKYLHPLFLTLLFFFISVINLPADILVKKFQPNQTCRCPQWEVLDLVFHLPEPGKAPFSVEFGGIFTGPDRQSLKISGFYNGENQFLLRFSPPQTGQWRFTTYSNQPALAGQSGKIEVTPAKPGRHGPIVISPEHPRHFHYADGTPYFLLAFELDWLFALDWDNPTDIPRTRTLIRQLAENGFNQVIMNVYAYDVAWTKDPQLKPAHEFGAPQTFPFGGTNDAPDFSVLNIDFFQHLDRVINFLDQTGVVAHLMIYVWNKKVNWPEMYSEADNRYFDYVIQRYQAFPNITWDISKEALGYGRCDMTYINERIARVRRLDAYQRLLTVHDYAFCSQFPEQVEFISIQSWRSGLYQTMLNVREKHSNKPVFNIEHGGYEKGPYRVFTGDYVDPLTCLARNYECVFAGTYSTYYWQCSSWNVIIPNPMALPPAERPRWEYYRYLVNLFQKYPLADLQPTQDFSSSGYCLSNGKNRFLFLLPALNYATHVILPESAPKKMSVNWFNPLTGEFRPEGPTEVRGWHEFKSPWPGQIAVLILTDETNPKPD